MNGILNEKFVCYNEQQKQQYYSMSRYVSICDQDFVFIDVVMDKLNELISNIGNLKATWKFLKCVQLLTYCFLPLVIIYQSKKKKLSFNSYNCDKKNNIIVIQDFMKNRIQSGLVASMSPLNSFNIYTLLVFEEKFVYFTLKQSLIYIIITKS